MDEAGSRARIRAFHARAPGGAPAALAALQELREVQDAKAQAVQARAALRPCGPTPWHARLSVSEARSGRVLTGQARGWSALASASCRRLCWLTARESCQGGADADAGPHAPAQTPMQHCPLTR